MARAKLKITSVKAYGFIQEAGQPKQLGAQVYVSGDVGEDAQATGSFDIYVRGEAAKRLIADWYTFCAGEATDETPALYIDL